MNLAKLFKMQKELDARILAKHPPQEGEDRLAKKILALQVELGELANEWRGFKFWSDRQTPTVETETCDYCGEEVDYTRPSPFMEVADMCKACWDFTREEYIGSDGMDIGKFEDYPHFEIKKPNKLLEEYVDCLHFILSIGLDLRMDEVAGELDFEYACRDIIDCFVYLNSDITDLYYVRENDDVNSDFYESLFSKFIRLGKLLGFNWEEVEQAYFKKNEINHERQESGY